MSLPNQTIFILFILIFICGGGGGGGISIYFRAL